MTKTLLGAGFAAIMLVAGIGLSTGAQAAALPAELLSRAPDGPLVQEAKGRGHAYGHRRGNRGLHRGWYKGRGNPHRFR